MANGDRFFGPNGASGAVTGTGAAITIPLDFAPQWVEVLNSVTGASIFWTKGMPDASGLIGGLAGGGGNTGATSGGTPAGTNGTSSVSAQTFTGDALAAHGHFIGPNAPETIAVTPGTGISDPLVGVPVGSVDCVLIAASGGAVRPAIMVPPGSVANTSEVSIDYATGILQFLVADAVTSATVVYLPSATTTTSAGTPTGTNSTSTAAAQVFTGAALGTHIHTAPAGGGGSFVTVNGITPGNNGFIIGADASINILGDNMYWNAGR